MDRPVLRTTTALTWQSQPPAASSNQQERLKDVHVGLPLPGVWACLAKPLVT